MILSEHEAQPELSSNQTSLEEPIVKKVFRLLDISKAARKKYDKSWQANYEFVFGNKQWNVDRPSWRFSEVSNYTWASMMTETGIQTDSRPKFDYGAKEASDAEFTSRLAEINDYNWGRYHWQKVVTDGVTLCKWVHVVHAESYWDPELEEGLGDVAMRILDPFYCYWDPYATNERELRWFFYAAPVPTSKLEHDYKQKFRSDVEMIGTSQSEIVSPTSDRMFSRNSTVRAFRDTERFGGEPMTILHRVWLRDDATDESKEESDKGVEYVTKLKYPKGRYLEIANGRILVDGPNGVRIGDKIIPYKDGEFPIAKLVNYAYPLEYAGENEVTMLRGPNRLINYIRSHQADQMKQNGSPKVLIGASAGVDPDNISAEPGQKIVGNDITQIRFEPGTGIAPGMQYILQDAEKAYDRVSGMGDAIRGISDPSITSGLLFDGYVEAAQVRPRLKNRNLDLFLQRLGQLTLSRYLQFYTAPRVFRITNKEGFPQNVEFFVDGNTVNMTTKNPDGSIVSSQQVDVRGTPDVNVQVGSALPFAKAQKSKTAMELFGAGAIDQQAVLEMLDIPDRDKILQRMEAEKQAQMQQQQQQAMAGAK